MLWFYDANDPVSPESLNYNSQTKRGSITLNLLKGVGSSKTPLPNDVQSFDVTVNMVLSKFI